jgi:hypothetical protein
MDPEPHDELVRLYDTQPALAERIDNWLDQIEANPADATVRQRLIRSGSLWAITVADPAGEQDYLILWDLDDESPVVRYLEPDVLRAQHDY